MAWNKTSPWYVINDIIGAYYEHLLHKKWSLPLRISRQFPADLVTFSEETLNAKLHFLCSDCQNLKNSSFLIHLDIYNKWMMRRFGIQKVKLCKTNLILRLWIWLIQSNHDKLNKKYSYILQKWPVAYQFRVYECFCIITFS